MSRTNAKETAGFRCKVCGGKTRVLETRQSGRFLRRTRVCLACRRRVITLESD